MLFLYTRLPSQGGSPTAFKASRPVLLPRYGLFLGMVFVLLSIQYVWFHRYLRDAEQHQQQDVQERLTHAAEAVAADVRLWLATGNGAEGSVSVTSATPHRMLRSHGLPIPSALWFFPPVGEAALAPPARLPADGSPAADKEMLLLARTRTDERHGAITEILALRASGLRALIASRQGACLRGAMRVPTHASAVLLYATPPSAALSQALASELSGADSANKATNAIPTAKDNINTDATVGTTLPPAVLAVARVSLTAAGLGDAPLLVGFESLCPSPSPRQIFATMPLWFWAAQGLAVVMLLSLGMLLWRQACTASPLPACEAESENARGTVDNNTTALAQQLHSERAQRKQLSGQLISLLEGVRCGIARELHDHTGQRLTAVLLALESAPSPRDAAHASPLLPLIENTARELRGIHEELRDIARGLRPPALDMLGLEAALRTLCAECSQRPPNPPHEHCPQHQDNLQQPQPFEVRFFADNIPPLFGDKGLALYRVAQECLHNAMKHAQATQIFVSLTGRAGELTLTVEDNGRGFALPQRGGLGLLLMNERMAQWGGTLRVESAVGQGTVVMAHLPVE